MRERMSNQKNERANEKLEEWEWTFSIVSKKSKSIQKTMAIVSKIVFKGTVPFLSISSIEKFDKEKT